MAMQNVDKGAFEYHQSYYTAIIEKTVYSSAVADYEGRYHHLPYGIRAAGMKVLLKSGVKSYRAFLEGASLGFAYNLGKEAENLKLAGAEVCADIRTVIEEKEDAVKTMEEMYREMKIMMDGMKNMVERPVETFVSSITHASDFSPVDIEPVSPYCVGHVRFEKINGKWGARFLGLPYLKRLFADANQEERLIFLTNLVRTGKTDAYLEAQSKHCAYLSEIPW